MYFYKRTWYFLLLITVLTCACQKDSYYIDTGLPDLRFDGTIMQFLKSRPKQFDTLIQVIQLAGMEDVFEGEKITFFAPSDSSIRSSLKVLNRSLYGGGKDSIKKLSQINPEVWKKELSLYIFSGKRLLKDYPQVDLVAKGQFPGQLYQSYGKKSLDIGAVYGDAGGVQYAGYRQLVISYIPSLAAPLKSWISSWVTTCNIQPDNGAVHVLRYNDHAFGFDPKEFTQAAIEAGISAP